MSSTAHKKTRGPASLLENPVPAESTPPAMPVAPTSDDLLRRDVRLLGDLLGEVISRYDGPAALELVERIRLLARERRAEIAGEPAGGAAISGATAPAAKPSSAERELAAAIGQLDDAGARIVARAFSIFFDVANIAEDRQRVRVLRSREAKAGGAPMAESVAAGFAELAQQGVPAERVQQILDGLAIELVFTAHPSEAKRRSIRAKLRRMRQALKELDAADLLPREGRQLEQRLRSELSVLWRTDFLRPVRPSVLDEVERGLSIMPRIWEVVPQLYQAIRRALAESYGGHEFRLPVVLRFGSWMGGDRDGNPFVTAEITGQTLCRLRTAAITHHLAWCKTMYDHLTIFAARRRSRPNSSRGWLRAWPPGRSWPRKLSKSRQQEIYRRWVRMIQWRLQQSFATDLNAPPKPGDYGDARALEADVAAAVPRWSRRVRPEIRPRAMPRPSGGSTWFECSGCT